MSAIALRSASRQLIGRQILFEDLPVMNFEVGPHSENGDFTIELGSIAEDLGEE